MKLKAAFFVLLATLVFVPSLHAQDQFGDPTASQVVVENISPADTLKLIQKKDTSYVLVDTQPPEAFEEEHVVGAVNFPWVDRITPPISLPRNKMLIVYCACNHDEDSIDMVKKLAEFGYLNTKVLEGGWFKWQDLKYPTAGTKASPVIGRPKVYSRPMEALASGRQAGEPIPSFRIIDVTGKYKGQPACYVCDYQEKPEVVAFFKDASPETEVLIVKLNSLAKQQPKLNFEVIMIEPTSKDWLEQLAIRDNVTIPLTYLQNGQKDVGIRVAKLNLEASNTVVLGVNRKVVVNFVNLDGASFQQLSDAAVEMLR